MSRPLRIQYPGAHYHIISRGNGGNNIFRDKWDYQIFLEELKNAIENHNWISYAYCLMPNHYHLYIKTLDPNLSIGMRQLNGNYTQRSNIRHKRYGHLFQGRFKSILVEDTGYQGELIRYITLNPIKAKLAKSLDQYPWLSHNEITGKKKKTGCVNIKEVLKIFHNNNDQAKKEYTRFLKEKHDGKDLEKEIKAGFILGSMDFAKKVISNYSDKESRENIKKERFADRPELDKIFKDVGGKKERDKLIFKAFKDYGYTQASLGNYLNIHYASISRIIKDQKARKI